MPWSMWALMAMFLKCSFCIILFSFFSGKAAPGGAYKCFACGKTLAEAEFTAQPLAALPPYGCGTPLAGAALLIL